MSEETPQQAIDRLRSNLAFTDEQNGRLKEQIKALEARLERVRGDRRHEVLCLVLKEYTRAALMRDAMIGQQHVFVDDARKAADLAYPPPKQEQP